MVNKLSTRIKNLQNIIHYEFLTTKYEYFPLLFLTKTSF